MSRRYALPLFALAPAVAAAQGSTFTEVPIGLPQGFEYEAVAPADYDGDGDLDLLATWRRVEDTSWVTFARLYRNDAPAQNRAPSAPPALAATPTADDVTLSWDASSDDHTAPDALTYNLWVTARTGSDIVSPMSRLGDGTRLLPAPGNVSLNRSWTLHGLPEGEYTWRVQAIDNAFNGGAFADGGAFTVGTPTATEDDTLPATFVLVGASPNPVRGGAAHVRVDLPARAEVAVRLYDVLGRAVRASAPVTVEAGVARPVGVDVSGLPSGVYLYRVEAALPGGVERASGRLTVAR